MFSLRKRPDFEKAFAILTDENATKGKLRSAKRALRNKKITPFEYRALVFLCALRGVWFKGDPVKDSFNLLMNALNDFGWFEEIKRCIGSRFVFTFYETYAVRSDFYALSYLAWAHYYGWATKKNVKKAKELVERAQKHNKDYPMKEFNERTFKKILSE